MSRSCANSDGRDSTRAYAIRKSGTPEEFIESRKFFTNVTADTLLWYQNSFKAFHGCETRNDYMQRIMALMERGLSAVSINTRVRVINAYLHWQVQPDRKCSPACDHLKLPRLKEEKKVLQTFSADHVRKLLQAKPIGENERRAQALALLILDTGIRVAEACALRQDQCDLENFTIKPMGKGRKERILPLSIEGRKRLYLWLKGHRGVYVFPTRTGTAISKRNCQRDLRLFCERIGIKDVRCSPHTLRHTFAVMYLRKGGNVEFLRRILGHTNILTTQRYLQSLGHEDVSRVHNELSPCSVLVKITSAISFTRPKNCPRLA